MSIDIFAASDDNYARYAAVMAQTLLDHTRRDVAFHLLDSGISCQSREKICSVVGRFPNASIEFIEVNISKQFPKFEAHGYISKAMYARFLIPHLFASLRKAIYLDVDILCMGDVGELYDQDLGGFCLGAVAESPESAALDPQRRARNAAQLEGLNIDKEHRYFNSGVLMLDCAAWNARGLNEAILEKSVKNYWLNDQDILNTLFAKNYRVLESRFNVINQLAREHLGPTGLKDCVIRHFTDRKKPDAYPLFCLPFLNKPRYSGFYDFWREARRSPFAQDFYSRNVFNRVFFHLGLLK